MNKPFRSMLVVALLLPAEIGADQKANAQAKAIDPRPGEARENAKDGLKYVSIPAGTFEMGCVPGDNECEPDEKPRHLVVLTRGFRLGQTLVTAAAFKRFTSAIGRAVPEPVSFNPNWSLEDHPIVNVSWDDAAAFCEWSGGRLPTEAEWERAARGGKKGLKYPWGDSISHDHANYGGTGGRDQWANTSPVESFPANGYGLYDMAGNAWEWCSDWYGAFSGEASHDPHGPSNGSHHVLRGGSWIWNQTFLRASFRLVFEPSFHDNLIGFRCARDIP